MNDFNNSADINNTNKYLNMYSALFSDVEINREFLIYMVDSISLNDPAHHLGHCYDVVKLTKELCKHSDLSTRDTQIAMVAALLHDVGCRYERKFHHVIGYGLSYDILHRYWRGEFNADELSTIAWAVHDHRSSNEHKPRSVIAEIVSVADSGVPDINIYIKRCIQYRLSLGTLSTEDDASEFLEEVRKHLIEKFGTEGYHWKSYPDTWHLFFKDAWDKFDAILANHDELISLINMWFKRLR